MASSPSLHARRRLLTDDELDGVPWLRPLTADERDRVAPQLRIGDAEPGELICRRGRTATYWFGVVDGLLKMSTETADGHTITYSGLTAGGWFGEGTVMKREPYRYNVQALRKSLVAGLPVDTCDWLLDPFIGFTRFVMDQRNERLAHCILAIAADRTPSPEQRVARNLAALANPVLFPGVGEVLRITQQELAYLVGLSRQRVNEALKTLAAQDVLRIEYGGLRILDLSALRWRDF